MQSVFLTILGKFQSKRKYQIKTALQSTPRLSSSVTRKLVPPSPLEKAIDSRFVKCNFLAFLTNISTAWNSTLFSLQATEL